MKRLPAAVMSLCLLATASSESSQAITITRSGSQPSRQGPSENFTGSVRIDPLFNANAPSRTSGGRNLDGGQPLLKVLESAVNTPAPLYGVLDLVAKALPAAYAGSAVPTRLANKYPTTKDLEFAYWVMAPVQKAITTGYIPHPAPPGAEELQAIQSAMSSFLAALHPPRYTRARRRRMRHCGIPPANFR